MHGGSGCLWYLACLLLLQAYYLGAKLTVWPGHPPARGLGDAGGVTS